MMMTMMVMIVAMMMTMMVRIVMLMIKRSYEYDKNDAVAIFLFDNPASQTWEPSIRYIFAPFLDFLFPVLYRS